METSYPATPPQEEDLQNATSAAIMADQESKVRKALLDTRSIRTQTPVLTDQGLVPWSRARLMAHHPRNTHSIISSELGWALITLRSLTSDTKTHEVFKTDKRKAGLELRQQLKILELKTGIGYLEQACIIGSSNYIDIVILQRTIDRIALSEARRRLQQAIPRARTSQDLENKAVLLWISAMTDVQHDLSSPVPQDALVDDFRKMVARLEALYVDAD